MSSLAREVRPGPSLRHVLNEHGMVEPVPAGWSLLPPGDSALSRRIKRDGPSWTVIEVRRMLAQRSIQLLQRYRSGAPIDRGQCPLWRALAPALPT